jgi:hypothetical protein
MTSTPHPPIEALRTLYIIGVEELLFHDVMVTLETPKDYQLCDLEEQILKDCHNINSVKTVIERLKQEFIIWTQHLSRKG